MKRFVLGLSVFALAVLACTTAVPQTVQGSGEIVTQAYDVGTFSEIELSAIGEVELIQGDEESVEVETDDNILPYVQVNVESGRLVLGDKGNVLLLPSNSIKYHVTTKTIEALEVNSSGSIVAQSVTGSELQLAVSGSGAVNLGDADAESCSVSLSGSGRIVVEKMACDKVRVDLSASGKVELAGATASLTIQNSGSGDALLGDLGASAVTAGLSGSGTATLWAVDKLDATVSGSGGLSYYGDPAVTSSVTGSGALEALGAH